MVDLTLITSHQIPCMGSRGHEDRSSVFPEEEKGEPVIIQDFKDGSRQISCRYLHGQYCHAGGSSSEVGHCVYHPEFLKRVS